MLWRERAHDTMTRLIPPRELRRRLISFSIFRFSLFCHTAMRSFLSDGFASHDARERARASTREREYDATPAT